MGLIKGESERARARVHTGPRLMLSYTPKERFNNTFSEGMPALCHDLLHDSFTTRPSHPFRSGRKIATSWNSCLSLSGRICFILIYYFILANNIYKTQQNW